MKRIVFLLEEKWHTESLPDAAAAVRAFREYGFDADLWILGEQETADAVPGSCDTLFIADSARLLRQLAEAGKAFCAYSHSGNSGSQSGNSGSQSGKSGSHSGNSGEDLSAAEYILMEPQWVDRDSLVKIWQRQRNIEARCFLEPPSRNRSLEREILTSYIRRVYRLCGYGHWAVISKNTGELIGRMGFAFPSSPGPCREPAPQAEEPATDTEEPAPVYDPAPDAMFGYLVRSDWRRQGITREVGAAILQYGFEKLGFAAIGADAAVSNTASDKILRLFSFIPVAEVQKQRYYILHETDWDHCPARDAQNGAAGTN